MRRKPIIIAEEEEQEEESLSQQQIIKNYSQPKKKNNKESKISLKQILITCAIFMMVLLTTATLFQQKQLIQQLDSLKQQTHSPQEQQLVKKIDQITADNQQMSKLIAKLTADTTYHQQQKTIAVNPTIASPQDSETKINSQQTNIAQKFNIPKYVWVYLGVDIERQKYIIKRGLQNIKWYSKESGYELRIVNSNNYNQWIKEEQEVDFARHLKQLEKANINIPQMGVNYQKLKEQVIMLHLLQKYGGVIINYQYIFTEKLQWINDLQNNINVNRGNPSIPPMYFAFFNINDSPKIQKENKEAKVEIQKMMVKFPGITDYFLAGIAGGEFLKDLLEALVDLSSKNPTERVSQLDKHGVFRGQLNPHDYGCSYTLAAHLILHKKQKVFDSAYTSGYNKFAVDHYGLYTMNSNYFPDKMAFFFRNKYRLYDNFYSFVGRLTQEQFQDVIGPMRYISHVDPLGVYNQRIEQVRDGNGYIILEGSFIHRQLFLDSTYSFITPNKQKPTTPTTYKPWSNLPKILWLYWDKGIQNASAGNQLCIMNMMKNAKAAGYEVKVVTDQNSKEYLDQSEIIRIKDTLLKATFKLSAQTPSDFYRLALIAKHGGIYLDASYYFTQSFDWITNIAKEPTQRIYNRFGEVPKVLQQFHPLQGAPFIWQIDQKVNTKVNWHLALESNFIAADKDSQYIKEWYDMLHFFVRQPYSDTQNKMKQCNTNNYRWTEPNDRYLVVMDSLKVVLGCRQKDIEENPSKYGDIKHSHEYYGLWSFNGFSGFQKYRHYSNYANTYFRQVSDDTIHMYKFSKAYNDAIFNPVYKGIKMYSWNIIWLNRFFQANYRDELETETHPDSYLRRYLFNKTQHEFYFEQDKIHARAKK